MFGEKGFELIKELKRSADGNLPAFNVRINYPVRICIDAITDNQF